MDNYCIYAAASRYPVEVASNDDTAKIADRDSRCDLCRLSRLTSAQSRHQAPSIYMPPVYQDSIIVSPILMNNARCVGISTLGQYARKLGNDLLTLHKLSFYSTLTTITASISSQYSSLHHQ